MSTTESTLWNAFIIKDRDKGLHDILLNTSAGLKEVTPYQTKVLMSTHISNTKRLGVDPQKPSGLVYILHKDQNPAELLENKEDLCGGVSLYPIYPIQPTRKESDLGWLYLGTPSDFLTAIHSKFNKEVLCGILSDFSIHANMANHSEFFDIDPDLFNKPPAMVDSGPQRFPTPCPFGSQNCSISILQGSDPNTGKILYYVAIRNYDPIACHLLKKWVSLHKKDLGFTTEFVIGSDIYQKAVAYGKAIRNSIAFKIGDILGCRVGSSEPYKTSFYSTNQYNVVNPLFHQHYNVLARIGGSDEYIAFYDGCANISEDQRYGVLLGLGRDQGYKLYHSTKPRMFGNPSTIEGFAGGFPLGVPLKPESDIFAQEQKNAVIEWGPSHLSIIPKSQQNLYDTSVLQDETISKEISSMLDMPSGFTENGFQQTTLRVLKCYTSVLSTLTIPIEILWKYQKGDRTGLFVVPLKHPFVATLLPLYQEHLLKTNSESNFLELFKGNDKNNVTLSQKHFEPLLNYYLANKK